MLSIKVCVCACSEERRLTSCVFVLVTLEMAATSKDKKLARSFKERLDVWMNLNVSLCNLFSEKLFVHSGDESFN